MAPLRPDLTPVRRAVGVVAVLFLLGCAVVYYRLAPGVATSSSSPGAIPGAPTSRATSAPTPAAGDTTRSGSAEEKRISLEASADSAKPFQIVRIQGTYHGGARTLLRVQRFEQGRWLAFPIPTHTDPSGRFTAYVELGQPGRYRLRVLDPDANVTSETLVLMIKN